MVGTHRDIGPNVYVHERTPGATWPTLEWENETERERVCVRERKRGLISRPDVGKNHSLTMFAVNKYN